MFKMLRGVSNATSGYSGGYTNNPTYETVCAHTTGHAEVVQIEVYIDSLHANRDVTVR